MAIEINNVEVERRVRELTAMMRTSLTAAIGEAVTMRLGQESAKPRRRPTVEEMLAATGEFRMKIGLDMQKLNVIKADFDELWE